MSETEIIDIAREAIWMMIVIGTPVMMVGLLVGVIIALLQALTQVQEITLVFVPKILTMFMAIFILFPSFIMLMSGFMQNIADRIIGIG